ncbi:D-alanyl-D-alanine carboxypeptidase [Labrys sp. LIt4]|uniref:D-alanyl-D-alanine carboxypeptidase family protein n=1 Tax=Labrys sp. LIt4 TaxID=2821355 RepID=UPI001AE07550|nr:D-alanyl-D-alanine carboxypeptidase family protein [Labrys sp. LIt4]MBP0580937.1 D-alanyl-D-alanine carboxypeptidase [Labrys sp. LIt4]
MKSFVIGLFLAAVVLVPPLHAEPFTTAAPIALVIETGSGTVLLDKNADKPVEPAAMAKIMTVAVVAEALRKGQVSRDTEYLISEDIWRKGGAPSGSATMFAAVRSRVRVDDLLRGVMVQAANDACLALSEGLTGQLEGLVPRMNTLAAEIGLQHTQFRNVTGFADPAQLTTARDLARLLGWLRRNEPDIYAIYRERDFTWNKIRQTNRNPLLTQGLGVDGGVTGASDTAGYGVVVSAVHGDQHFIMVLHGLQSNAERASEAKRVLEWAENSFRPRLVFTKGEIVGEASVFGGTANTVPVVTDRDVSMLVDSSGTERLSAKLLYDGPLEAPVRKNSAVGRLQILREGQVSLEIPLYAAADVLVGSLPQRAFGAIYELGIGLIQGGHDKR